MHYSYLFKSIFRPCDSRNLNLSPFCDLQTSSLVKWQPAINSTYGNITTDYTSGLPGPMRLVYPTEKKQRTELLSSLTKVMIFHFAINSFELSLPKTLKVKLYNIQCISKGSTTVQRLRKGYRCSEYLLCRLNCLRYPLILSYC